MLINHTGLAPSVQLARNIPEFDVALSGHTHESVYKPILVGKTIVIGPGSIGSFIGQLDLTVNDGKINYHQHQLIGVEASRFEETREIKSSVHYCQAPFARRLNEVVGQTKERQPIIARDSPEPLEGSVLRPHNRRQVRRAYAAFSSVRYRRIGLQVKFQNGVDTAANTPT